MPFVLVLMLIILSFMVGFILFTDEDSVVIGKLFVSFASILSLWVFVSSLLLCRNYSYEDIKVTVTHIDNGPDVCYYDNDIINLNKELLKPIKKDSIIIRKYNDKHFGIDWLFSKEFYEY